jgi:hypothetical protein
VRIRDVRTTANGVARLRALVKHAGKDRAWAIAHPEPRNVTTDWFGSAKKAKPGGNRPTATWGRPTDCAENETCNEGACTVATFYTSGNSPDWTLGSGGDVDDQRWRSVTYSAFENDKWNLSGSNRILLDRVKGEPTGFKQPDRGEDSWKMECKSVKLFRDEL